MSLLWRTRPCWQILPQQTSYPPLWQRGLRHPCPCIPHSPCLCHLVPARLLTSPFPQARIYPIPCPQAGGILAVPCADNGIHIGRSESSSRFLLSSSALVDHNEMDGIHMIVTCSLHDNSNVIKSHAIIVCGATGYAFIDEDFARRNNLPLHCLHTPYTLHVIDGRPSSSGSITHITRIRLRFREHQEDIPMFVSKLGQYPIVLRIPWLRRHDVWLHFATNKVTFSSKYCLKHCILEPVLVHCALPEPLPIMINAMQRPLGHTVLEEHEVRKVVPEKYHDFLPVFLDNSAQQLPPHRLHIDHEINLVPGFVPPYGPLYNMSQNELKAQKEWIDDNLAKGFI